MRVGRRTTDKQGDKNGGATERDLEREREGEKERKKERHTEASKEPASSITYHHSITAQEERKCSTSCRTLLRLLPASFSQAADVKAFWLPEFATRKLSKEFSSGYSLVPRKSMCLGSGADVKGTSKSSLCMNRGSEAAGVLAEVRESGNILRNFYRRQNL